MEKKLYLRIQAIILALFILLTTCVIVPQRTRADETVAAVEELTEAETGADVSSEAEQPDTEGPDSLPAIESETEADVSSEAEQPDTEGSDRLPTTEAETESETEADVPSEAEQPDTEGSDSLPTTEAEAEVETDADPTDESSETTDVSDIELDEEVEANADRSKFIRVGDYEFWPEEGIITNYFGTATDLSIPSRLLGITVTGVDGLGFSGKVSGASNFR